MLYSERKYILKLISLIILLSIYSFITSIYGQDYPDEFLDGLLYTPLKTPVLIPDVKDVYVNKETIEQYIMTDGVNPFTKEKLTLDGLTEFNNRKDNKEKIKLLMSKIESWKLSQKNKSKENHK